jgi:hypothetical protein
MARAPEFGWHVFIAAVGGEDKPDDPHPYPPAEKGPDFGFGSEIKQAGRMN